MLFIGLTKRHALLDSMLGWEPDSVGIHGYGEADTKKGLWAASPRFRTGDTVGCGLTRNGYAYFTKNGGCIGLANIREDAYRRLTYSQEFSSIWVMILDPQTTCSTQQLDWK